MFFYISGMGATFFNTEGKGFGYFVWGKILRLLIPFVIAIFVFLIPMLGLGIAWRRRKGLYPRFAEDSKIDKVEKNLIVPVRNRVFGGVDFINVQHMRNAFLQVQ